MVPDTIKPLNGFVFDTISDMSDAAQREEETLAFWRERKIFEKSLEKGAPKGEYVFYDGPPFATDMV